MGHVCVVGSANVDLVARVGRLPRPGETVLAAEYQTHPGGKGRNQAVTAARAGAPTAFVGCVGADPEGEALRATLAAESIDTSGLAIVDGPTGRAFITVDGDGENAIVVVPGANAAVGAASVRAAAPLITRSAAVLAQLEVGDDAVAAAFDLARRAGGMTILNAAPARDVSGLLALTDVLIVNEHEAALVSGRAVTDQRTAEAASRSLLSAGPTTVVVTLGAAGAIAARNGEVVSQPAFAVEVVDTTGSGDAACGALAAALANGEAIDVALARACAAGALAASAFGATPATVSGDAIDALVSAGA